MICLDTNFLIRGLVPGSSADAKLRSWLGVGMPVTITTIAWAEFLCGPVNPAQVAAAVAFVPDPEPFLVHDARRAAELFNAAGRRRGSMTDCMIAAICLRIGAAVVTANVADFKPFEAAGLRVLTG